jgi:hypothetical protein
MFLRVWIYGYTCIHKENYEEYLRRRVTQFNYSNIVKFSPQANDTDRWSPRVGEVIYNYFW